jgi:creatinine amidohydrolase
MDRAYTGAPREATVEEGEELYEKLVTMVVTEVSEALVMLGS